MAKATRDDINWYAVLLRSVAEFNALRREYADAVIDLSDADLSDANLSDADLSDANLSDANLSRANLSRADLSDANLSDANLSDANLSDADLSGADVLLAYSDGWIFYGVRHEDGPRIQAGCHWFTVAEALGYWGSMTGRDDHRKRALAAVRAIVIQAEAHGWDLDAASQELLISHA